MEQSNQEVQGMSRFQERTAPLGAQLSVLSPSNEDIAKRAYEKFLARDLAHGFDRDDWLAAERELLARGSLSHDDLHTA